MIILLLWIDDGHGAKSALVLIGFLAEEPVFRTTHTAAHCKHAFPKLQNLLAKYFLRRYGKNRCFSNTLASIISQHMGVRM